MDVIADSTERRLTRDLMFDAVPNSSASIFAAREIWSLGGRISEIMLVPLLHAQTKVQLKTGAASLSATQGGVDGGEGRGRGVRRSWRGSDAPWPTPGHAGATQAAAAAPGDMCEGGSQGGAGVCVCAAAHPRAISSDLMSFLIFQISMLASLFGSAPSDMLTCHRLQTGVSATGSARPPHAGAAARLQLLAWRRWSEAAGGAQRGVRAPSPLSRSRQRRQSVSGRGLLLRLCRPGTEI